MEEGTNSKIPLSILLVILTCSVLIILLSFIDNTYGEVKRENARLQEYNKNLLIKLEIQDQQLQDLEKITQQLTEELTVIVDEQKALKEKVKLEETIDDVVNQEGIGGPLDEDDSTLKVESIQTRIDILQNELEKLQEEFNVCEQTLVDIDEQANILAAIPDYSPLEYLRVGSNYGYRIDPITEESEFHSGIDFTAPRGTEILASGSGIVTTSGWSGSYGKLVIINHGNGYVTMYAHCSFLKVEEGQEVTKGEVIALVGSTGRSTGNHLHFSILYNGCLINPQEFSRL